MRRFACGTLGSALGFVLAAQGPAYGQEAETSADDGLADIIVTASRMGETRLQDTPLAVSAIGGEELSERGITDVQDLKAYVPSLQVSDLSGFTQLYIRGIGSNIVFIGSDPSTTIHVDGVYMARPLSYFNDFLDVERIEVLRGPQGTLYGRNSVGGTINVVSRRPSADLTGEVQAELGTYGTYGFKGYVSGPLTESGIRASIAADVSGHDAYRKNVSTGNDIENGRSRGVRGQLLVPVGEGDLILRADWSRQSGALGQYPKLLRPTGFPQDDAILGDYGKVSMDLDNRTVTKNYGGAADLTLPLGDTVTLHSLTAYREFRGRIVSDADSSAMPILRTTIGDIRQHQFSQELTLDARVGPVHFVGGGYYFRERNAEPLTLNIIPAGITFVQRPFVTAESYAFFGQADIELTDTLSLVAGLRWTKESKHFELDNFYVFSSDPDPEVAEQAPKLVGVPGFVDPYHVDVKRKADAFTPKFGINFRPRDGVLLYASATRGFKSGGYDLGSTNAAAAAAGYGPEYLWSYEIGAKTDLLDGKLRANVNAFLYDYTDLQVQNFVQDGLTFGAITQNAATARVKGVELELMGKPARGLELFANVSYLDARYRSYPSAFVTQFANFDAHDKRLNNAPKWSATFGASYTHELNDGGAIFGGVDAHVQSRVFFTAANDGVNGVTGYPEQQKGYGLVNARLGWSSASDLWKVVLTGSNIFDQQYILGTANYTAAIAGRPGRPRVISASVTRRF
ncbi:TonB-dependent receptor [Croceicoccus estronivorus]|nr:TonB-dependent receptor [Croceicoccus estronivorus]